MLMNVCDCLWSRILIRLRRWELCHEHVILHTTHCSGQRLHGPITAHRGHVTQPSHRSYQPALALIHKPYSEMNRLTLSQFLPFPGRKTSTDPTYRMIHLSYAHQLHTQVPASSQLTPAAPMLRKHKPSVLHSRQFIMRQAASPVLGH